MSWRDFNVGLKLFIGFGVLIAFIIISGLTGFSGIQSVGNSLFIIGDEEAPLVDMANEMKISLWASRNSLEEYKSASSTLATYDKDLLKNILEEYDQTVKDFDTYYNAILNGAMVDDLTVLKTDNPELAELVREADTIHNDKFQTSAGKMIEEGQRLILDKEVAETQMVLMEAEFDEILSDASDVEELISEEIQRRSDSADLNSQAVAILQEEVPLADLANELKISLAMSRIKLEEYVQQTALEELVPIEEDFKIWVELFDRNVKLILDGGRSDNRLYSATDNSLIRQRIEELDSDHSVFQEVSGQMMNAHKDMVLQSRLANEAMDELDKYGEETNTVLNRVEELAGIEMQSAKTNGNRARQSAILILSSVVLISILSGILLGIIISKGISAPLKEGVDFAETLASGDLTAQYNLDRKDEIGKLAEALSKMSLKLNDVISGTLTGSEQIASASEELAKGNQDLSVRTEQQATALEETSSAIEEMNSSIRSNADSTSTAATLSDDAMKETVKGAQAFEHVLNSMENISLSSKRIADIIAVINNIAFQTNLLALNASIEAARAGEQGKGFAVVAVEVRKLAKRSDKAASEIAGIIKDSNSKVDEGVKLATEAGSILDTINNSIKKVTSLVSEISAASNEQLSTVDQIDRTLSNLDENTQRNAALVEEAAASTEELSGQAQELNRNMQFFKLERSLSTDIMNIE